jgi:very-short-patch-repair endonuclease
VRTFHVKLLSGADVVMSGPRDRKIATIAAQQRGRVARRQLIAVGISDHVVSGLIRRDVIFRLHRSVYAVGHLAPYPLGDETAALLAMPDVAALGYYSAGSLWGMLAPGSGDGLIHIVIRGQHSGGIGGVKIHRSRMVTPADIRIHDGGPVTSPARTLLDLGELLTERELELAYDRALVARILSTHEFAQVLLRAAGRRRRRALQRLLDRQRGPTVTRSEAEERFLALIRSANLPEPMINAWIHGYEVDFLWPGRLIVEIDGFRFHSTRRAFEHDHRKDAVLRAAGLPVLRFTWEQITGEQAAVVALVAQSLAAVNGS